MGITSEFHANKIDISRAFSGDAGDLDFKLVTAWSDEQRRSQQRDDYHKSIDTDDAVLAGGRRNNFNAKGTSALSAFEKRRHADLYFQLITDQIEALNQQLAQIERQIDDITFAMAEIENQIRDNGRAIKALQTTIDRSFQTGAFEVTEDGERLADHEAEAALRTYEQRMKKRIDRDDPANMALIQQILEEAIKARRDENADLQRRYDEYESELDTLNQEREETYSALQNKIAERDAAQKVETDALKATAELAADNDFEEWDDFLANAPDDTAVAFKQKASGDDEQPTPGQNDETNPVPMDDLTLDQKL